MADKDKDLGPKDVVIVVGGKEIGVWKDAAKTGHNTGKSSG